MKKEFIDYSLLVDDAMHLIVKKSLKIFAENYMNIDHHFFISFITKYPGVELSNKLRVRYPYEMTIVLQYQFEELVIADKFFSVLLTFDGQKEKVVIPFAALTAFADPTVKFGLQFRHLDEDQFDEKESGLYAFSANNSVENKSLASSVVKKEQKDNVISLDFKNKKLTN